MPLEMEEPRTRPSRQAQFHILNRTSDIIYGTHFPEEKNTFVKLRIASDRDCKLLRLVKLKASDGRMKPTTGKHRACPPPGPHNYYPDEHGVSRRQLVRRWTQLVSNLPSRSIPTASYGDEAATTCRSELRCQSNCDRVLSPAASVCSN